MWLFQCWKLSKTSYVYNPQTISVGILQLLKHVKWHHEGAHSKKPQKHPLYSHYIFPLQITCQERKKLWLCSSPYDPKFTKCLLRGECCIHTDDKYFSSVNVVMNHQAQDHKNIYKCSLCIKFISPNDPIWLNMVQNCPNFFF